jgi:hypothetical protein
MCLQRAREITEAVLLDPFRLGILARFALAAVLATLFGQFLHALCEYGMRVSREITEGCLRPIGALCCALLGKGGRGIVARPAVGHLLGRVEPVAQPATPEMRRWLRAWE